MCKVKCDKAKLDLDFVVCCVSSIGALQMPSKFSNKLLGNVLLYNREKLNKLALSLAMFLRKRSSATMLGTMYEHKIKIITMQLYCVKHIFILLIIWHLQD